MSVLCESALQERLRQAMKNRAAVEVAVLRGLIAAIRNVRIEKRVAAGEELGEADLLPIVRREIKQREEAIGFAEQGGRAELVEKNRAERDLLQSLLPQAPSIADLEGAVERLYESGATNIGALMAGLKRELGAGLDGRVASEVVKRFLGGKGA